MTRGLVAGFVLLSLATVGMAPTGAESATANLVVRSSRVQYDLGDRIDWTVDWTKLTAGTSAEQVVVDLDGQHEFVEGSVEAPRGWTVEYSEDGETYSDSSRGYIRFLRFSKDEVSANEVRVSLPIPRPIPPIVTARNGGDGYIPMLAGDRVFAVWHHLPATGTPAASVVCIDTLSGKACPGYPKPLGMQTSYNQGQGAYFNPRLFIKNRDATTHGVKCWDTVKDESCGYFPIATLGPVTGTAGGDGGWDQFSSPVTYEGRLYFAGQNHRVYCFDPATSDVCDGYTMQGKAMARAAEAHVTTRRINDVILHDGHLYYSLANSWADSPIPLGTKVECFDLDSGTPCAGFGTAGVVSEATGTAYMFTRYSTVGAPIGFCLGVQASMTTDLPVQATVPCYDFDGTTRTTIPSAVPFAQFRPYNVEEATIDTRTFVGRYSTLGAFCYDWSTSAPCTGTNFNANGLSTKTTAEHFYGFVKRGQCMVGLGHKGVFMSVDPLTGATPCRQIQDNSFVAAASARYCRDTKYLDGWSTARLTDVSIADFSNLEYAISDGTTRVTGDESSGPTSLASMINTKPLGVVLKATVNPGADPWATSSPSLEFVFSGSHQFCFQTVAKPMPTPEEDAVVDVITDEGEKRNSVAPDPVLLTTGALTNQIPETGSNAAGLVVWGMSAVALGATTLGLRRRRACRR